MENVTPAQVPPLLPPPTPGLASPALPEPRPAIWPHAVASVILLIFFAWAGGAPASWPKSFTPYTFSQTGWIIPARGIPQILIASAALFLTLSGLARRTLRAPSTPGLHTWIPLLLIAVIALEIHLILLRAWSPLGFAGIARTAAAWRIAATCANLLSLALLMLALHARKKSPWLAALFIWHPLTLLAAPVAGSGIACLLPLLILAAPPWRWFRWMRELLLITPAALSVWWIAHSALTAAGPVNGLAS
ncbi:MAG TPA: hypothetical protein VHM90_00135, partial [Phycisphaerae bacterium]|nr:hypothetical protein [Phycisphaerae bacterium]